MIKTVIFDLGGVLLDIDMHQCFENIKALGVDVSELSKETANDRSTSGATMCEGVTASGMLHLYQVGGITTDDFLGTILRLSRKGTTYQQVVDAWNSCLLTIPDYKLQFIKQLRDEGYTTYLLSNTNDAHWVYIKDVCFPESIDRYFSHCFLSQEMGMAKPNEDIYLSVLSQIPFAPSECLFLDDAKANCTAAEALGINCMNVPVRTDFREDVKRFLKEHK